VVTLRSDGRVTIPKYLRNQACLREGDVLQAEMTSKGILLRRCPQRKYSQSDKDQWWYWTDEWQAGEQQIIDDHAAGRRGPVFTSGAEFLAALQKVAALDETGDKRKQFAATSWVLKNRAVQCP